MQEPSQDLLLCSARIDKLTMHACKIFKWQQAALAHEQLPGQDELSAYEARTCRHLSPNLIQANAGLMHSTWKSYCLSAEDGDCSTVSVC